MNKRDKIVRFLDKNINKPMYNLAKDKFKKDFLNLIFETKGNNFEYRTDIFINAILDEEELPYYLIVRNDYERGSAEYWTLVKYIV